MQYFLNKDSDEKIISRNPNKAITITNKIISIKQIHPRIHIQATIQKFGYNPLDLEPWSRKKVIIICSKTGNHLTIIRCNLNKLRNL